MEEFDFSPGLGQPLIRIMQSASGAIGAKVYPGALSLCCYFAASPLPVGAAVIEVGAGACGLPSLFLAAAGARVIATDAPAMLPLLEANVSGSSGSMGGGVRVAAFDWADANAAAAVRAVAAAHGGWGRASTPSYIIGADVVYHEPLIAPLLAGLRALTTRDDGDNVNDKEDDKDWEPPLIILAYIQRFKRAKKFFKEAAKDFSVTCVAGGRDWKAADGGSRYQAPGGGLVTDYEGLTWALPRAQAALASGENQGVAHIPTLAPGDADYARHCARLVAAAAFISSSSNLSPRPPAALKASISSHHVDSDSGDEWVDASGAASTFLAAVGAGDLVGDAPSAAAAAAAALGVPLAPPVESYIYILKRRKTCV